MPSPRHHARPGLHRLLGVVGLSLLAHSPRVRAQLGPARVVVESAERRPMAEALELPGTAQPRRTSIVATQAQGLVVELLVEEGDHVCVGQKIAQLRTRTLEIELAGAKATLASLEEEQRELENGSRPDEITRAEALVAAARAQAEWSRMRLERMRDLSGQSAIILSPDELDAADAQSKRYAAEAAAAEAVHRLAKEGPRKERIAQSRARAEAQREEVRRIEDEISKRAVKAPFDGYVTRKRTELGQTIVDGGPVIELIDLSTVEVQVMVLEDHIGKVRRGLEAPVRFDALGGAQLVGKVVAVIPQADVRSRQFPVKVRLENPVSEGDPLVKAGMLGRVLLPLGAPHEALVVPKDALVLESGRAVVYVVEDGKTRLVPVSLGGTDASWVEVEGDLEPGDKVVTRGNERLRPGEPVELLDVPEEPRAESTSGAPPPSDAGR